MADVPLPPGSDPDAIRQWALGVMASHGLDGWSFEFTRGIRTLGVCRYRRRVIGVSRYLVERNAPEQVRDTLLHEIAHALVGPGHGHDAVWRAKAAEIGARPERCSRADIGMPEGRWAAACGGCGSVFRRHRRPKRLAGWHCRQCGRDRGQLIWSLSHGS